MKATAEQRFLDIKEKYLIAYEKRNGTKVHNLWYEKGWVHIETYGGLYKCKERVSRFEWMLENLEKHIKKEQENIDLQLKSEGLKQEIFTDDFLKEIGFTLIEKKKSEYKPYPVYGKAKDRVGMTIIQWCDEGHSCTYFGEKLEPNTSVGILKDGGTRHAFNGYVFCQDDVRKILSLTW